MTLRLAIALLVGTATTVPQVAATQATRWPVKTREHVDLWLHGFAMVSADSSPVPLYRRGYREAMVVARNAASAFTDLDANADALRATLGNRPALLGAQFLALQFGTWADLDAALDLFIMSDENARGRANQAAAATAAVFGQDRKSTRLNSSHIQKSRMPSSA